MNPPDSERAMKRFLKTKLRLQERTILKDQLLSLKTVGTNETQSFAVKICKKIKSDGDKVEDKVVNYIMNKTRGSEVDPLDQPEEIHILSVPLLLPVPLPG